jgi:hypothetical protein
MHEKQVFRENARRESKGANQSVAIAENPTARNKTVMMRKKLI